MTLLQRLQDKLKIRESALQKRIQRAANKEGISTKDALLVLASLEGIGIQTELKKLGADDRSKIQVAISHLKTTEKNSASTTALVPKLGIKKELGIEQVDPFLGVKLSNEANEMAGKAYLILYFFENSIRNFINMVMTKNFGSKWWDTKMKTKRLMEIAQKVRDRKSKEKNLFWHSKRGAHELYYSDFDDLRIIIETYKNNFDWYFKGRYKESYWISSKISESYPSRNVTAHNNPLSDQDVKRLDANFTEWIAQIKYIKDNFTF